MISRSSLNIGQLGPKARSHCSNMEKPFSHSSGHIFYSTVMKLGQDACLGNCSDEFVRSSWPSCFPKSGSIMYTDDDLFAKKTGMLVTELIG
jgi:hypothetical protein